MIIVQLIVNGILAGANYALMALGFCLIFSTARFLPFSHVLPYTTAAYSLHVLAARLGLSLWIAAPFSILIAGSIGCLTELVVYRRLRSRGASSVISMLASLGLLVAFQSAVSVLFGDQTLVARGGLDISSYTLLGARVTSVQLSTLIATATLFLAVWWVSRHTRVGKMQRALASDSELAGAIGLPSGIMYGGVFAVGSGIAGVAGILAALDTDITPTMGFNPLLMGVVATIAGGVGSVQGALWGGLLVGLAQHLGVWKIPTLWQDAIGFLILILFLLVRPQGFFGKPLRRMAV